MKARSTLGVYLALLLLALGLSVACSRSSAPDDAQIMGQVQTKLSSNSNLQGKQIGVQSSNGVVTLSGTVSSDFERTAAANDAAQVEGVRTVVNNLQIEQEAAAQAPAAGNGGSRSRRLNPNLPAGQPRQRGGRLRSSRALKRCESRTGCRAMANTAPAPMAAAPARPSAPVVRSVTIPQGSTLAVRLIDAH